MARKETFLPQEIIPASSWLQAGFEVVVPLMVLLLVILIPYPEVMKYQDLDGDAKKFRWVYSRLNQQQADLDVALVGTSRTMVAVNDSLVECRLAERFGVELSVANLGVSWQGRDMAYLLTRALVEARDSPFLIIEVQESLARTGHPLFATLAGNGDILGAPLLINREYFHNLWNLPGREAENLTSYWGYVLGWCDFDLDLAEFAHRKHFPFSHHAVPGQAQMERLKAEYESRKVWHALPEALDALEFGVPRAYLQQCVRLARADGVELVFLYLPYYGFEGTPQDEAFFQENGSMLVPPDRILQNADNWYDATHLNSDGNRLISEWLAGELARLAKDTG